MFKKIYNFLKKIIKKIFCCKQFYVIEYTTYNNKPCNIHYAFPKPFGDTKVIKNEYKNGVGKIFFDKPVTKISTYTFRYSYNIKSITIPNSVIEIQPNSFNCKIISAFYGKFASPDNKSLIIGDSLIAVAFGNNKNYEVPENIKNFNNLFSNIKDKKICVKLNNYCGNPYDFQYSYIQLISNVENIPDNSFRNNVFSKITLTDKTKSLGDYSFMRSKGIYVYDMPQYNQFFSNNCQIICKANIPPKLGNNYIFGSIEGGTDQDWENEKFAYKSIKIPKSSSALYNKKWSKYKPYFQYVSMS